MNNAASIDFQHPADGFYMIERKGNHPNARAGIVQIIDDTACRSIVNRFNQEAEKPGFPGLLVDHEHFRHQDDQETRAYGWCMKLENRSDGIYGQIRWTGTGKQAVDGGDYRFFSTEYKRDDLQILSNDKPRRVRPLRLDGLTLTNMNNNSGQNPITNKMIDLSEKHLAPGLAAAKASHDAHVASDAADSADEDEKAADAHQSAAEAHGKMGHTITQEYHIDMASAHKKTSKGIRDGVSETVPADSLDRAKAALDEAKAEEAERGVSEEEETKNRRTAYDLATERAASTGESFVVCWNQVRDSRPELFAESVGTIRNRQASVAAAADTVDGAANSAQLRLLAEEMKGRTGATFSECWNRVCRANPNLLTSRTETRRDGEQVRPMVRPGMRTGEALLARGGDVQERLRIANSSPRRAPSEAKLSSADLDDAITAHRAKLHFKTYALARDDLRNRRPGLFGC